MMDGFRMNDEAVTPIVPRMTTAVMHGGDRWIFMVLDEAGLELGRWTGLMLST
jgi:hypothetical protein